MAQKQYLSGSGLPAQVQQRVVGGLTPNLTALGNSQATALLVSDDINVVTNAAASTGVILPSVLSPGDAVTVVNYGANTLAVYPPVGGKLNNAGANAAVNLATLKAVTWVCIDNLNFYAVISA